MVHAHPSTFAIAALTLSSLFSGSFVCEAQAQPEAASPDRKDVKSQESSEEPPADPDDAEAVEVSADDDAVMVAAVDVNAEPPDDPSVPVSAPDEPVEVTVIGTSVAKTAGAAQIISHRDLERTEYDDPHAVLQAVPGVYSRGEDGVGLRPNVSLRGVNPDRSKKVALMEDGVPFGPAPYSAPAAYYFPLMTRMTQVRVIKGPSAISYGPQTVGGAIDLVTRPIPSENSGTLDVAGGQYGYTKLHGHFGSSDLATGYLIEGVHLSSSGFKNLPSGADTGFYRNEWMFKGSHVPDPSAQVLEEWRLKVTYSEELSNETYVGLTDGDFRADPLRRYGVSQLDQMKNHRTSFVLSHIVDPTPDFKISTTAYRHDFFRIWRKVNGFRGASLYDVLLNPETPRNAVYAAILDGEVDASSPAEAILIGPNEREFVSQGVSTVLGLQGDTGPFAHRAEYGMRLHNDGIARRHSEDAFYVNGGSLVPEGSPSIVTTFNEASTLALALHAIDAVSWNRLTLTPGLRFEAMRSSFTDHVTGTETGRLATAVLPGFGAFYSLTPELGALAGAYRGFSPPPPGSEEFIEPEFSVNYEAGARYADAPFQAEAIGFFNDYENLTDICTLSSGCVDNDLDRQFDAGEAHIYGVEAYATHYIPAGDLKLPISLAYTLTFANFENTFTSDDPIFGDVEAGDEVPYVPRHQGNLSLGIENERFGVNAGVHYTSAVREQAGSEPFSEALTTDEVFLVDAGGKYQLFEPLAVYINVRNLLDAQHITARRPFGARPNAPRWVQVGAKLDF